MTDYVKKLMSEDIFKKPGNKNTLTAKCKRDLIKVKRIREQGTDGLSNYQLAFWINTLAKDLTDSGYGDIKFYMK